MFELLLTALNLLSTALLLVMITFLYKFKRDLPDIEQVLVDVGESIGEQLTGIFKDPMVKQSMSVMGKKSGDVRADKALKNRVADKALGQSVIVKKALDYFGLSALEGLELMQDPTFGPIIQGFIQKGGQGLLKGFNSPGNVNSPPMSGHRVPNMS